MKRTKASKGITLIALIITIVVLLILASVTISNITNNGIIDKAQETVNKYELAQEREKLQIEFLEWQLINSNGIPTLQTYLAGIYGEGNVQLNVDKSITVTVASGNKYMVTIDGVVTLLDGTVEEPEAAVISVSLDKTEITKEITHGESVTEIITATLNNVAGTLTWISSDTSVAEISGTGNTRTITLKSAGTATITVSYGEYNATCIVTVTEKKITLTVTPTTITEEIEKGSSVTKTLTANLVNASGTLNWTTSNAAVASVSGNGNTGTVILKSAGTATITVSYEDYNATCTVNVTEKKATIIEFKITEFMGDTKTYQAEEGMTLADWVKRTEYNTDGYYITSDGFVVNSSGEFGLVYGGSGVRGTDTIKTDSDYGLELY